MEKIQPILALNFFNYESMVGITAAGANLVNWVIKLNEIFFICFFFFLVWEKKKK